MVVEGGFGNPFVGGRERWWRGHFPQVEIGKEDAMGEDVLHLRLEQGEGTFHARVTDEIVKHGGGRG